MNDEDVGVRSLVESFRAVAEQDKRLVDFYDRQFAAWTTERANLFQQINVLQSKIINLQQSKLSYDQSQAELSRSNIKLKQTEVSLKRASDQLKQTEGSLKRVSDQLKSSEVDLKQLQLDRNQLKQSEITLKRSEATLKIKLKQANEHLSQVGTSANRQGAEITALREQLKQESARSQRCEGLLKNSEVTNRTLQTHIEAIENEKKEVAKQRLDAQKAEIEKQKRENRYAQLAVGSQFPLFGGGPRQIMNMKPASLVTFPRVMSRHAGTHIHPKVRYF